MWNFLRRRLPEIDPASWPAMAIAGAIVAIILPPALILKILERISWGDGYDGIGE